MARTYRHLTITDLDTMIALHEAGETYTEIARRIGRPVEGVWRHLQKSPEQLQDLRRRLGRLHERQGRLAVAEELMRSAEFKVDAAAIAGAPLWALYRRTRGKSYAPDNVIEEWRTVPGFRGLLKLPVLI